MKRHLGLLTVLFSLLGPLVGGAVDMVPNFKVIDSNPHSERYANPVSPRDYILQVSGYYFANAG